MKKVKLVFAAAAVAALPLVTVQAASADGLDSEISSESVGSTSNDQVPEQNGEVAPMSADGCTTAPGPAGSGSHNCVVVNGNGTRIDSAYSQYYYAQPVGPAVCDRHHQFLYTAANGEEITRQVDPPGCINSLAMVATGDSVSLPEAPLDAQAGTGFCTRAMNNQTGGLWTPWACIDIH